jgi:hypothetical protein
MYDVFLLILGARIKEDLCPCNSYNDSMLGKRDSEKVMGEDKVFTMRNTYFSS